MFLKLIQKYNNIRTKQFMKNKVKNAISDKKRIYYKEYIIGFNVLR